MCWGTVAEVCHLDFHLCSATYSNWWPVGLSAALSTSINVGAGFHEQYWAWLLRGACLGPRMLRWFSHAFGNFWYLGCKGMWPKNSIKLMTALNFRMSFNSKQMNRKGPRLGFHNLCWNVRAHYPDFISKPCFHCCCQIQLQLHMWKLSIAVRGTIKNTLVEFFSFLCAFS